jgi:hypothetical protein
MVIADQRNQKADNRLRRHFEELVREGGTYYNDLNGMIVEGLLLQNSAYSVGIQIADFLVGSVYRKFSKGDSTYFDLIAPILRKPKNATSPTSYYGHGLVLFPK